MGRVWTARAVTEVGCDVPHASAALYGRKADLGNWTFEMHGLRREHTPTLLERVKAGNELASPAASTGFRSMGWL